MNACIITEVALKSAAINQDRSHADVNQDMCWEVITKPVQVCIKVFSMMFWLGSSKATLICKTSIYFIGNIIHLLGQFNKHVMLKITHFSHPPSKIHSCHAKQGFHLPPFVMLLFNSELPDTLTQTNITQYHYKHIP